MEKFQDEICAAIQKGTCFMELVELSALILSTDPSVTSYDRPEANSVISTFTEMQFFRITSPHTKTTRSYRKKRKDPVLIFISGGWYACRAKAGDLRTC